MYDQTMGKRKREIIENIKRKIELGQVPYTINNTPLRNINIKKVSSFTPQYIPSKIIERREGSKDFHNEKEENDSFSSNDIFNTNESWRIQKSKEKENCTHTKMGKCNYGKHVILDYYEKGKISFILFLAKNIARIKEKQKELGMK